MKLAIDIQGHLLVCLIPTNIQYLPIQMITLWASVNIKEAPIYWKPLFNQIQKLSGEFQTTAPLVFTF